MKFLFITLILFTTMAKAKNKNVKGVVFWQGESDAVDYDLAATWKQKALAVLRGLRKDVCNKNTKFLVVVLNSQPNLVKSPYWLDIRQAQQEIKVRKIDSDKYPFDEHQYGLVERQMVHLTVRGYRMISRDISLMWRT